MIPRTIVARPEDLEPPAETGSPDILPLPGGRRAERETAPPVAPPPHSRPQAAPEFGPRDILNALRYHSVLFVTLGTLAAAGLFTVGWLLVGAKYTTYATLYVDQRNPTTMPSGVGTDESGNFATVYKTQATLIKNRRTIGGALLDPKSNIGQLPMLRGEEDPAEYLEKKLIIDVTDTSNSALRVELSGDDPMQITAIVNAIVNYYMKEVETWREEKARRIATLQKTKADLERLRDNKLQRVGQAFAGGTAGEPTTFAQKMRVSEYVDLIRQRAAGKAALNSARGTLKAVQEQVARVDSTPLPIDDATLTQSIDKDQDVITKTMFVKRLARDLKAIEEQSANPNTLKAAELRRRVPVETAELESLRQKVRGKIEATLRSARRLELAAAVEKAQAEVQRLEALEQSTEAQLAEFKEFKDMGEADVQKLAIRVPEEDAIRTLRAEIEQIDHDIVRFSADLTAPERVRLWHAAEVPTKKDIRKQAAISGAAGFFGLGLVGGLVTLYEMRRKRVYGPGDPIFKQKAPLLGCLPDVAAPTAAKADGVDPAGRAFFEAVDKIKAVLCRQLQRRRMQAVLITSAIPGEGKSGLAWHLALSLARSDRRTLFVDGNLRNPGLHKHFDLASQPGLSELLRGERAMSEVVQRTALENLWCIAAGVCDEASRQALDKDSLRQLLDRARRDFDFVIIDSCSIREAVDPLYLAQRADATVLAVRTFHSGATDVERACDRLTQLGTPLLGAVLTDPAGAGCEL